MFFKKKKEAKAAAARDAKQQIKVDFEKQLKATDECRDPAERFLKLEEFQQSVDAQIKAAKEQIAHEALQSLRKTDMSVTSGSMIGVAGLAVGLHVPPLMLLIYPAMIASSKIGRDAAVKTRARLEAESAPLFEALEGLRDRAHERADFILKTNLTTIAESPKFADILAKAPRIRDHFTAAFVKKVTDGEIHAPGAPKKPDNSFKL